MSVVSISLGFRGIVQKKCHLFTLILFGYIFEHSSCNDVIKPGTEIGERGNTCQSFLR